VRDLLREAGIADATVVAREARQRLRSPEDWWTNVLCSGFRWTIEQLGPAAAGRVRAANLADMRRIDAVETTAIYATARKPA